MTQMMIKSPVAIGEILLEAGVGAFYLTGKNANLVFNHYFLSEIVVIYDASFDDLEVWSFDHEFTGGAQLLVNMDVQTFNSISAMRIDPSGRFLFLSASGGDVRQWAWDGSSYYELYDGVSCGSNTVNSIFIAVEGSIHVAGSASFGDGVCNMSYRTSASPTVGYEFGVASNYVPPGTANHCEIGIFGDYRINAERGTVGAGMFGLPQSSQSHLFTLSLPQNVLDWLDIGAIGAWGVPWGRALIGWDRDNGYVVTMEGGANGPWECQVFQVWTGDPNGILSTLWINESAMLDEPECCCIVNGYVVVMVNTTPSELQTWSIGAGSFGAVDSVEMPDGLAGEYAFVSPYTNKVYVRAGNMYCYDVDESGTITYLDETIGIGISNDCAPAFYPTALTPHIDTTIFWNGLESYWDMDEASNLERNGQYIIKDDYGATTGTPIVDHVLDSATPRGTTYVMFDGFAWSCVRTANTPMPKIVSNYVGLYDTNPGGVWPGALTYSDFGFSDVFIESYVRTKGAGDSAGVVVRFQDIDNFIYVYINPTTDLFVLAKVEGGSETVLDSTTVVMSDNLNYRIRVWTNGENLMATHTYANTISSTSSFLQTSTKHGQYLRGYNGLFTDASWFYLSPFPYTFTDNTATPNRTGSNLQYSGTDKAGAFTADNMSLVTTGTPFDSTGTFQIGMMVDFTSTTGSQCTLMCKGDSSTSGDANVDWCLGHTGTAGSWFWRVRCGGTLYSVEIPTAETPRSTEWTFVTAYYDAGSNEIGLAVRTWYGSQSPYAFQNVYKTTAVGGTRNNDHSTTMLGSRTIAAAEPTVGGIDKVFLYSRVLSHDEWLWLANYGVKHGRRFVEFPNMTLA